MFQLGIRGMLAIGLAALLATAAAIAALVAVRLVGTEAEGAIRTQQRWRARSLVARFETACTTTGNCDPQLREIAQDTRRRLADQDVVDLLVVGAELRLVAGTPEDSSARRDPLIADAFQMGRTVARPIVRGPAHRRGQGLDHRVAVPMSLGDGRRMVLQMTFDIETHRAAIDAQQRRVLLYLLLDFAGVLLFGIYLSGRHLVRPIQALTHATERIAQGPLSPDIVPAIDGPAEIVRLRAAFCEMVARLALQHQDLTRTLDQLRAARDDLIRSEKLATVGKLAAGVAHEVGNPLSAVIGYIEYLRDERGTPPDLAADLLGRVDQELNRIRGTVRQLLDFSRPADDHPVVIDPAHLVRSAVDLVRYQRNLKTVAIEIATADTPPIRIDPARFRQVIVNLLLNAADVLDGRGQITVTVEAHGAGACIRVADRGPGVPDEVQPRLFDPFFTTKPAGAGTGLGLAICRRIAEEAGGRVWHETPVPTEGEPPGACFCLWIPAAAEA